MEQHRFGSTQREVAVIGQGTWYIAMAIVPLRSPPCAEDSISV